MSPADLEISGARRDGMGKQTTNGIAVSIPFKILADKPKMKGWSKMKQGLTLTDLAREIERQQETKRDLIADTRKVEIVADDEKLPPMMRIGDNDPIGIRDSAHVQIAGRVGIPSSIIDGCRTRPPTFWREMSITGFKPNPKGE
jgi:hypothetical protein